jgi:hypothetical protein
MSFQWIIDNAESISIESKKIVASTTARDGTTRAVSRGGQTWRIEVKLPDGISWTQLRQYITQAETLDRTTNSNIQFNNAGHSWFIRYQGDHANLTAYGGGVAIASITRNSPTITLTTSQTLSSGFKFRVGDYIQLSNTGYNVYRVIADVPFNSNTVTVHRPVLEPTANNVYIRVGQNCVWRVICTQFPSWTLFARDQISWNGPFVFVEAPVV